MNVEIRVYEDEWYPIYYEDTGDGYSERYMIDEDLWREYLRKKDAFYEVWNLVNRCIHESQ